MEKKILKHVLGANRKLYQVLFDYIIGNKVTIKSINQDSISKKTVRRLIATGDIFINGHRIIDETKQIAPGNEIEIKSINVRFYCEAIEDSISDEILEVQELIDTEVSDIDNEILQFLQIESIDYIDDIENKKLFCLIIDLAEHVGFSGIKESSYSYKIFDFIKNSIQNSNLSKELDIPKTIFSFTGKLVEFLISKRKEIVDNVSQLFQLLISGSFDKDLFKFLSQYNKIITTNSFQNLLAPNLNYLIFNRSTIEGLIKPIFEARQITGHEEKFLYYDNNKDIYINYLARLLSSSSIEKELYKPLAEHLSEQFNKACETNTLKTAVLQVSPTSKRYNFQTADRVQYELKITVKNIGEGLARAIFVNNIGTNFAFTSIEIGSLRPLESRDVILNTQIQRSVDFEPKLSVSVLWTNPSSENDSEIFELDFKEQIEDVPWDQLERSKPYSIQEIESRDKLYGRDEILEELKSNILSDKIESYKIWGQKRVGKSSIVKTLKSLFNDSEKIIVVWRSIAGLRNADPVRTLNDLGEAICSEILEEIDNKLKNPTLRQNVKNIPVPDFNGSLLPLENYIRKLRGLDSEFKFVIIIDEFDRINDEFFLPGALGDTLSLNIGKGLNEKNYIGFILVGSENMQLLDRQGINYNNYQEREIDTFNKKSEYNSFVNIVTGPVEPYIKYSVDSIDRIFTVTNGNPYFANLICSYIFKIASTNRDSEIDTHITNSAIDLIVNSSQKSHYEHFWGDGITEETNIKKERKSDIRRRILVSYSLAYFQSKSYPNKSQIIKSFNMPSGYEIENYEIENTINEFYNRKIFYDDTSKNIRIKPALFEDWLCGPGRTLMIEGVSDLEALHREKELEIKLAITGDEFNRIKDNFSFVRYSLNDLMIESYFNQFGSPIIQRRIFNLIDSLLFISREEVTKFIRAEQKNIFSQKDFELKEGAKTFYREGIEFFSFKETIAEENTLFQSIKTFSHIRPTKTLKDIDSINAIKKTETNEVILFTSIISDFHSMKNKLLDFLKSKIFEEGVPCKLLCILITSKAKTDLIKLTSGIPNFKLITYKEVDDNKIKPFIDNQQVFETQEESRLIYAEVKKHFPTVSKNSLNVLFETHCPAKSIPILWCETKTFTPLFINIDGVLPEEDNNEVRRDKVYHLNRRLSQGINKHVVTFLKSKADKNNDRDWFTSKYLPISVIDSVNKKYHLDKEKDPKETYFDFINYLEIVKKHEELSKVFNITDRSLGNLQLKWMEIINDLRRDPAHSEKPVPTEEEVLFFESVTDIILNRIDNLN